MTNGNDEFREREKSCFAVEKEPDQRLAGACVVKGALVLVEFDGSIGIGGSSFG